VPDIRWETIRIDFVIKLPEFVNFDIVMIIIDLVSKRTHIAVTIEDAARLFLYMLQFKTQSVKSRKKPCIRTNIRELDSVPSTKYLS